jgi:hypothetical protein
LEKIRRRSGNHEGNRAIHIRDILEDLLRGEWPYNWKESPMLGLELRTNSSFVGHVRSRDFAHVFTRNSTVLYVMPHERFLPSKIACGRVRLPILRARGIGVLITHPEARKLAYHLNLDKPYSSRYEDLDFSKP